MNNASFLLGIKIIFSLIFFSKSLLSHSETSRTVRSYYLLCYHHKRVAIFRQEIKQTEELETVPLAQQVPSQCLLEVLLAGHHPAQVVKLLLVKHSFLNLEM